MADKVRALVVDDEEPLRGILRIALSYFGVDVIGEAGDGVEAIEAYQKLRPNVVIMDVNMPRMDGLQALEELRKIDEDVVVIIITASDDENMKLEGIKRGCKGFLHKPLKMDELHNDIMTTLRVYFARQAGQSLEKDYYRYVVKPDFRSDSIRAEQRLPARPGIHISDPDEIANANAAPARTESPPVARAPASPPVATTPAVPPVPTPARAPAPAPSPARTAAPSASPSTNPEVLIMQEELELLRDENKALRAKLERVASSLQELIGSLTAE